MFLWCTTNTSTHSLWISVFVNTGDVFYFSQSMKETLKVFSIESKSFVMKMFLVADNVQTTTVSPFRLSPLRESEKKTVLPWCVDINFFSLILFDSLNGLCRKGKTARILDDVFCVCNTFEFFLAKIKLSSFRKLQSFAKKSFHVTDVQNL